MQRGRAGRSANEGLSWSYRLGWRLRSMAMHVFGPAQLDDADDPHERLRRERAVKVARARREPRV